MIPLPPSIPLDNSEELRSWALAWRLFPDTDKPCITEGTRRAQASQRDEARLVFALTAPE